MTGNIVTTVDGSPADLLVIVGMLREMNSTLGKILELLEAQWGPIVRT